jgi:hypothetical protein
MQVQAPAATGTANELGGFTLNAGGQVRSLEEALQIASQNGVQVPSYVSVFARPAEEMPLVGGAPARAAFAQFGKNAPGMISWEQDVLVQGQLPLRLNQEILASDEAIICTLAHETHEITTVQSLFEANGGVVSKAQLGGWINAPYGSVHQEAVQVEQNLLQSLRGN